MRRAAVGIAVSLLLGWSLAPAVWQLLTAVKPDADITAVPTVYWPSAPTLQHFRTLFTRKPFALYLRNSAVVAGLATLLTTALGAMAASALVRLPARRRETILGALLALAIFPPILLLFPVYEGVRALGWLNSPLSLLFPYAAMNLPLSIWVLESGFAQVPRAVDEAAQLDGLGPLRRLWRIHLPLAGPSLAASAVLVFIFCWNELLLALTFLTREERKTVTAGIASVGGASMFDVPWGQLSAAVVVTTAPLVLLVLLFERRIVSGLTRGAVKG